MEQVKQFLERDQFARLAGIELLEIGEGRARARMPLRPDHLNGAGVVQGGAIFTLADLAFAAACNSHGNVALAVETNIRFVKAVRSGTLLAEAREEALSARLSTCTVRVTDEEGALVALFGGTAYRKTEPIAR